MHLGPALGGGWRGGRPGPKKIGGPQDPAGIYICIGSPGTNPLTAISTNPNQQSIDRRKNTAVQHARVAALPLPRCGRAATQHGITPARRTRAVAWTPTASICVLVSCRSNPSTPPVHRLKVSDRLSPIFYRFGTSLCPNSSF